MKFIMVSSVILILLTVAKGILPNVFSFLPLGGSNISEMGIVFGIAVAVATIVQLFGRDDDA